MQMKPIWRRQTVRQTVVCSPCRQCCWAADVGDWQLEFIEVSVIYLFYKVRLSYCIWTCFFFGGWKHVKPILVKWQQQYREKALILYQKKKVYIYLSCLVLIVNGLMLIDRRELHRGSHCQIMHQHERWKNVVTFLKSSCLTATCGLLQKPLSFRISRCEHVLPPLRAVNTVLYYGKGIRAHCIVNTSKLDVIRLYEAFPWSDYLANRQKKNLLQGMMPLCFNTETKM